MSKQRDWDPIPFQGMKVLEIDIETKPAKAYVWGTFKQNIALNQIEEPVAIICFAARWQHQKSIIFKSVQHHGHEVMMETLWDLLDEADVVVHYNGKRFDIPHINRELIELDFTPPSPYHQIDLYHIVRSTFKFQSNKLDHVVERLLQERKLENDGMPLWTACMAGDRVAWAKMKRYNLHDVRLLRGVYLKLQPWITKHPNRGLYMDPTKDPICPNCGCVETLRIKAYRRTTTRVNAYDQYLCDPAKKDKKTGRHGCGFHPRKRIADKRQRNNILT